jgi:hypothetical protein
MPQVKAGRRDAAADAAAQGEALIAIGRYEHALATIARGLILAPGDVRLHCQRSIALLRLGRIRGSLQAAGDAISADPDEPWAHQLKAAALSAQARSRMRLWRRQFGRQAQSAARRAVHLGADDAGCFCTAAGAELLAGDWPAAHAAAAQAIALAPGRPDPYVALSHVALAARDFATARAAATHALSFDPRNYPALANLGSAQVGLARWKSAADTFALAARLDPCELPARQGLERLGGMIAGVVVVFSLLLAGALVPPPAVPWGAAVVSGVGLVGTTALFRSSRLRAAGRVLGLAVGVRVARLPALVAVVGAAVGAVVAMGGTGLALDRVVGASVAVPALAWCLGLVTVGAAGFWLVGLGVERWRGPGLGPSLVPVGPRPLGGVRTGLVIAAAGAGWWAAVASAVSRGAGEAAVAAALGLIAASFTIVVGGRTVVAVRGRLPGGDPARSKRL